MTTTLMSLPMKGEYHHLHKRDYNIFGITGAVICLGIFVLAGFATKSPGNESQP